MSESELLHHRYPDPADPVHEQRPHLLVRIAFRPGTEDDAGHAVEPPRAEELGEVAVQAVGLLADVLQAEEGAPGGGAGVGVAEFGGEQTEAAAEEDAPGTAGYQGGASSAARIVRTVSGANRVARRWSWARVFLMKSTPAAMGPCRVTSPARVANAS